MGANYDSKIGVMIASNEAFLPDDHAAPFDIDTFLGLPETAPPPADPPAGGAVEAWDRAVRKAKGKGRGKGKEGKEEPEKAEARAKAVAKAKAAKEKEAKMIQLYNQWAAKQTPAAKAKAEEKKGRRRELYNEEGPEGDDRRFKARDRAQARRDRLKLEEAEKLLDSTGRFLEEVAAEKAAEEDKKRKKDKKDKKDKKKKKAKKDQ